MGERLAIESPVEADLVIGVPDSGVPAAEGFAVRSGIPFGQGLVKNRYIGRTFIAPTAEARSDGVRRKLNPLRESVGGKRLVVIDDSIVRGTTTSQIVRVLREAGAREIHLRISSPPFRWPCFYGIDTPVREELLAAFSDPSRSPASSAGGSVAYLSLEGLFETIGVAGDALLLGLSHRQLSDEGAPSTPRAECSCRSVSGRGHGTVAELSRHRESGVQSGGHCGPDDPGAVSVKKVRFVVETGVDPVTSRFSGARSAN